VKVDKVNEKGKEQKKGVVKFLDYFYSRPKRDWEGEYSEPLLYTK